MVCGVVSLFVLVDCWNLGLRVFLIVGLYLVFGFKLVVWMFG